MASLNLDDADKKNRDLLDLSRVSIRSEAELQKWMEKIPNFKIRPENVKAEEVRISTGDLESGGIPSGSPYSPHHPHNAPHQPSAPYPFLNPVPASMRDVNIRELGRVNINWRMLTVTKPKTKLEEDIFSRLVQLEKLQHRTVQWEHEQEAFNERPRGAGGRSGGPPAPLYGVVVRGRRMGGSVGGTAVTETRRQTCRECGEEFCTGTCKKYLYDEHSRTLNPTQLDDIFKVGSKKSSLKLNKKGKKVTKDAAAAGTAEEETHEDDCLDYSEQAQNSGGIPEQALGERLAEVTKQSSKLPKPVGSKPKTHHRAKKAGTNKAKKR